MAFSFWEDVCANRHHPEQEGHPIRVSQSAPCPSSSRHVEDNEELVSSSLLEMLRRIPDPRSPRGRQFDVSFVLAVCVVAVLAGASGFRQIADQARDLPQPLLARLGSKWSWFTRRYQYPSRSVIRRVLTAIDTRELDRLAGEWIHEHATKDGRSEMTIALDGKVLRGAWTGENDHMTLFSAMLHDEAVTIAQVRVPDGTNEITQVECLLDTVTVPADTTVMVTVDAAHTQTETAEYLKGTRGFDYLMTVKGNQPTLEKAVAELLRKVVGKTPHDVVEERSRGRIKRWSCWITDAHHIDFPHITRVACIRRDVLDLFGNRLSKEVALAITSRTKATANYINRRVRTHWGIENKSHYIRDTVWQEDANQTHTGSGPHALATLRNLATALLRLNGAQHIKETTEYIGRDRNRALPYLLL